MTTTFAIKNPEAPATPAQIDYLKSLVETHKSHAEVPKIRFALACNAARKGQVSKWIDTLKFAPKDAVMVAHGAEVAAKSYAVDGPVVVAAEKPAELAVPEFGYYEVDGTIYCFNEFAANYGGKHIKMMKLKHVQVYDYKLEKYVPKGKWIYAGSTYNAKKMLAGAAKMTVAQAAAKGHTVGFCIKCGRTLTDPVSVAQGIGPVCIKTGIWG